MAVRDQIQAYGHTGIPTALPDGSDVPLRLGRNGEVVSTQAHGQFHEAASRQNLYLGSIAVAGVAPGTALGTTPPFALWNPTGSGKILSIKRVHVGYVSGTLGAGSLLHAVVTAQPSAPTGGTELTPANCFLGATRSTARLFTGSTVAATPTILRPSVVLNAMLASTATQPSMVDDWVDGSIIVPPGMAYVLQAIAAAGSTPLVVLAALFEEITTPS